jgi:methyl-accepting chemotaxis protein
MLGLQTDALNRTVKVFQDVDSHMVDLLNKINSITANMKTITVSKDDVLDAIKNIAAVTQQTLASSEVVDTNINNQIVSIETLNTQAEDLKERAKELEEAIARFTI